MYIIIVSLIIILCEDICVHMPSFVQNFLHMYNAASLYIVASYVIQLWNFPHKLYFLWNLFCDIVP